MEYATINVFLESVEYDFAPPEYAHDSSVGNTTSDNEGIYNIRTSGEGLLEHPVGILAIGGAGLNQEINLARNQLQRLDSTTFQVQDDLEDTKSSDLLRGRGWILFVFLQKFVLEQNGIIWEKIN